MTIATSGTLMVLFGIMAIINSQFDPFQDPFLLVFVLVNHLIIELGIRLILKLQQWTGWWIKNKTNVNKKQKVKSEAKNNNLMFEV